MHAYVSHILRKGGGGTENGGLNGVGVGICFFFFIFSSKVPQIRHSTKKSYSINYKLTGVLTATLPLG